MAIHKRDVGDVTIFEMEGKFLGGPETMEIHFQVKELVSEDRNKIVFDMEKAKLLNSTALGCIMSSLMTLRNADGNLKLCCLNERMKGLFKVTDIITVFETFDTVEEAIASYQ